MREVVALKVAIDLVHMPSRARSLKSRPLPDGVVLLLRIAAGDEAATTDAVRLVGRSRETIAQAAAFFIEQILLVPGADSYRVLGADETATPAELRRNMALLLRWLHPDLDRQGERSIYAGRVTRAWEDLKTPERRAAYDKGRHGQPRKTSRHRKRANPAMRAVPRMPSRSGFGPKDRVGLLRRILMVVFGISRALRG
jgi:hypothetical protein